MRILLTTSAAIVALMLASPVFAQTDQQTQLNERIPPGNTEAQPWQPAAPHGQAMDQQHQASHRQDTDAGQTAATQIPQ
jgi:hypothetical protein